MNNTPLPVQPKQNTGIKLYPRLLKYILPYKFTLVAVIVMLALMAALEPSIAHIMKNLVDKSLIEKDTASFIILPLTLAGVFILRGFAEFVSTILSQWLAHNAIMQIRNQLHRKMQFLPFSSLQNFSTGELMSKVTYDVTQTAETLSEAWIVVIRDSLIILALFGYLLYTSWQLTLLVLIIGPIVGWIIDKASRAMRQSSKNLQQNMGQVTARLEEGLSGFRDVKIYGAEKYEQSRFDKIAQNIFNNTMRVTRISALNVPLIQVLSAIALAIVVYFAMFLSSTNALTPGELLAYITAMALIFEPIRRLTNINLTIQKGMAAAESIFTLLDMPEEENTGTKKPQIEGHIEFKNLTFSYPNSDTSALKNINLIIAANKVTALVGQSGSGKTTLANLIARFLTENSTPPYLQEKGIFLDKIPLQEIELEHLRQNISYVSQSFSLFNASVRENIAYGQEDATEEEIIQAAKNAFAWEFIENLPQDLDTNIGEKGALLSGGQRQRIALARAFLKDAPILILDEATSALDNESEAKIQLAMQELCKNRTVIIIAHRLTTIENSDKIVVMQNGTILEQGKHQELLDKHGYYAQLYKGSFD